MGQGWIAYWNRDLCVCVWGGEAGEWAWMLVLLFLRTRMKKLTREEDSRSWKTEEPEVVDMNETAVKQIEGRRTSRRSEVNGLYYASILFIRCIRLDEFWNQDSCSMLTYYTDVDTGYESSIRYVFCSQSLSGFQVGFICSHLLWWILCKIAPQALTNVWWQNIENFIGCSETKLDQWFCIKHDKIIAHVFTMILHRTWKHNRPGILWHTNIDLFCALWKISLFITKIGNIFCCLVQYIGFCQEH